MSLVAWFIAVPPLSIVACFRPIINLNTWHCLRRSSLCYELLCYRPISTPLDRSNWLCHSQFIPYTSSCSNLIHMRNPINGATSRSSHSKYSSLVTRFTLLQHPPHPISAHSRRINFSCNNSSAPGVYMSDLITLSLDKLHETVAKGSETFTQPIVLWINVSDV